MNDRASPDEPLPTRTEAEGATVDLPEGVGFFSTGQVLGERYEILEMLGRGGMGEVWRAFDLKLRVEVGLKALREELFQSERRLELLRQEVRAAREVVSPNVCRIFDLIEIDGRELVSMEYVDGATLLGVLQERGPLELKEAQDIASQFLAGLEAIHKAGLVHRDVKPENIMLTRAGRVVVMDFGLARGPESGAGSVSGTPAYMAPEHAAGQDVDARADVYSAGVVLAEMVSPEGIKSYESRQSVWEGVRSEPAQIPDSPWAPVIKRAVARDRERRPNSAHTLIRELEDVTLRVEGAEDLHPYPGLASFTEEDTEYFFGRESEIEAMWAQLEGPPRLLGLVGPSGAGKSSFLRAGLIPNASAEWSIVRCTPGNAPFVGLGQALAATLAGDAGAMQLLPRVQEIDTAVELVSLWSRGNPNAVLIVDQFEELFTLSSDDEQGRFASLLARLPLEADVHVLLSMRDDFLMSCNGHESLRPIIQGLTLLDPPTGANLRRALVQPATRCGYRFEDDELVDEMLDEVEGERGALPMLAFAAARLWEKRDRESGLLTRHAYHDIGGVGGALARHAETTIDHIGVERIPIVRELFRNLVTAEGTRAVREWDELISVFGRGNGGEGIKPSPSKNTDKPLVGAGFTLTRDEASDILLELIDARLLTSYEVRIDEFDPTRRVEIIHESLLANWPRLVRWQTQDADSARLRDELRQAARTWDEHGRSDDLVWTGSAFQEFTLWRERYGGGLTDTEKAFATAMTSFSTRRKRLRRAAVAALLVIAVMVAVVTTALWRRSVLHERRAEAQKIVALGKMAMKDYPTAALAHATRSLELADSEEARFLSVEALSEGPPAFIVSEKFVAWPRFSSRGSWIVHNLVEEKNLALVSHTGEQRVLPRPTDSGKSRARATFGGADDLFLARTGATVELWSAPEGRVLASARPVANVDGAATAVVVGEEQPGALFALREEDRVTVGALDLDGEHRPLDTFPMTLPDDGAAGLCTPSETGAWIGAVEGNEVSVIDVGESGLSDRRRLGRHEGHLLPWCWPDPFGRFLLTVASSGQIKLWDATGDRESTTIDDMQGFHSARISRDGSYFLAVDASGPENKTGDVRIWSIDDFEPRLRRRLERVTQRGWPAPDPVGLRFAMAGPMPAFRLWSLAAPAGADPVLLRHGPAISPSMPAFSPDGHWIATGDSSGLIMWPLARPDPVVLRPDVDLWISSLKFAPDGRFLAIAVNSEVSLIPLDGPVPPAGHTVFEVDGAGFLMDLAISPDGELFVVCDNDGSVWLGRDDGVEPRRLPGATGSFVTFSPNGRHIALSPFMGPQVTVWDVSTAEQVAVLGLPDTRFGGINSSHAFAADGRLLTATSKGLLAWDITTGDHEVLVEGDVAGFFASEDARRVVFARVGESVFDDVAGCPEFADFDTGHTLYLQAHGLQVSSGAMDPDGKVVVSGDRNGIVRIGLVGEEPHLMLGHTGEVTSIAMDPGGRWIASTGQDNTVRLWPMPDLSKPPLHALPRDELIAKLKTLTNIRLVPDPESSTGWKLTHEPFQGWETVPTW